MIKNGLELGRGGVEGTAYKFTKWWMWICNGNFYVNFTSTKKWSKKVTLKSMQSSSKGLRWPSQNLTALDVLKSFNYHKPIE